jgi:hypothetical protein
MMTLTSPDAASNGSRRASAAPVIDPVICLSPSPTG